jgi:cytochrome c556
MSAIGYHAQGGRTEAAVASVDALAGMMGTLTETSKTCHTTDRKYFVDAETIGLLDAVKSELGAAKPDPAKIGANMEAFAQESCTKCHLVHIPGAFARYGHE